MDKLLKVCLVLLILFVFIFGIALIVISSMPSNEVKALLDSLAPDGNFEGFSIKHIILIRSSGILLCFFGGLVYVFRKKVLKCLSDFIFAVKISDFLINPKNILALVFYFIRELKEAVKKEDKIHTYSFVLLLILAIGVRILYLFHPWVSDETRVFEIYIFHSDGLTGLIQLLSRYDVLEHMFSNLLSFLSFKLFGNEQNLWVTRLPAFFAGILLVPTTYMVMRIFYNKNSALLASGILAASSDHIFYSARSRGYSIVCLIFFLILALAAYLKKNNNLAGWQLFAILSAFGFYTIPLMLWPYGIVVSWLLLSIILKDTDIDRVYLLKNLFISIVLTAFVTVLLYSPVITGLTSFIGKGPVQPLSREVFIEHFLTKFTSIWNVSWNRNMPYFVIWFFVIGFFISIIFHKRLSAQRVNIALATSIWLIPLLLIQRVIPEVRHLLFLLLLYIGLASAGLTYLFRKVERVFGNYKSAVFSILTIILSTTLMVNHVISDPWYGKGENIDDSGKFIDFMFVHDCLSYHIMRDGWDSNIDMRKDDFDKWEYKPRILPVFTSTLKNDFWMRGLKKYYYKDLIISDLNSFLSKDSRRCHNLYLVSSESMPSLEILLKEKGLPVYDYSAPQLIHSDKYARLYKMKWIKDCVAKPYHWYQWGAAIQFGSGGNAKPYQTKGWSFPEDGFTWSDGKSSSLVIPIETMPAEPIILKTTFMAFVSHGKVDKQTVDILINGRKAGTWLNTKQDFQEKTLLIPKDFLTTANNIEITFNTPDAASPALVGLSNDNRILSMAVRTLELIK